MAIRDVFKVSRKTFFSPSNWLDYDSLKALNSDFWVIFKTAFTPAKPTRKETFAEAVQRLRLTEADINLMAKRYRRYAILFLIAGLVVFYYSFYLVFRYGTFPGLLLGLVTTALFIAHAYKYEFWSFQMRERKLGCTFADWKRSILGEQKDKAS